MCKECHSIFSDEEVVAQTKSSLENPQFERWNTTSLNHTVIACLGYNGVEAQDLSLQLYQKHIDWAETVKGYGYLRPEHGLEPMPLISNLKRMYKKLVQLREEKILAEDIRNKINHEDYLRTLYAETHTDERLTNSCLIM